MLSNSDTAIAEKMGDLMFSTPKKEEPVAKVEAEAPQEPIEDQAEIEDDQPSHDGAEETGDTDEGEEDASPAVDPEDSLPPIEAPSGWNAEEKTLFSSLPRNVQETLLRRASDQTKEVRRLQNETADNRKKFDAAMAQVNQERQQLAAQIQQNGDALYTEFQSKFSDVTDPVQLAQTDPLRYTEWQAYVAKITAQRSQAVHLQQQQEIQRQENLRTYRSKQNDELRDLVPSLKDDAAFEKFDTEVTNYLIKQGFPEQEIIGASAKSLAIVHDAMQWRKAQASRKTQEAKVANVPKVMKPGAKRDVDVKAEQTTKLRSNLHKTGSLDAFAAAIRNSL